MAHFSKSFDENYIVVNNKDLYRVELYFNESTDKIHLFRTIQSKKVESESYQISFHI